MNRKKFLLVVCLVCGVAVLIMGGIWLFKSMAIRSAEEITEPILEVEHRYYEQRVIVEVLYWNGYGCKAVVLEANNHDIIKDGDTIFAHMDSPNTKVYYKDGTEFEFDWVDGNANQCSISSGSKIEIKFYALSYKNIDTPQIYVNEIRELAE